jgi:hypothetical protein
LDINIETKHDSYYIYNFFLNIFFHVDLDYGQMYSFVFNHDDMQSLMWKRGESSNFQSFSSHFIILLHVGWIHIIRKQKRHKEKIIINSEIDNQVDVP